MSAGETAVNGCHPFDCWQLTPEGAAIQVEERVAVIADLHLGYEWARGAAGDCLPAHSLAETIIRLTRVFARATVAQLIVAGDFVESARPCARTSDDVATLIEWLSERGVSLLLLEGNHDGERMGRIRRARIALPAMQETCVVAGWTIAHGHRPSPTSAERVVSGHHHPVLRVSGVGAPCFLLGPRQLVLPAFSCNAAGCDVRSAQLPEEWRTAPLDCIVSTGAELLDFGPLVRLRSPARRPSASKRPRLRARADQVADDRRDRKKV
jgi:putative SbcD/Mre11-related phosphoesterase